LKPFDQQRFESIVAERHLALGRSLLAYAETTSTNDVALRLAQEGAPHGLVVVADHQTQGRGRRGRPWLSPHPGENLLFSVLLRLQNSNDMPSNITLAMGLALRDVVQPILEVDVQIKWANDLLVDAKKLAGILVESQLQSDNVAAFVVGIGLNVHMREPPESIRTAATSLALLRAAHLDRELLLADLMHSINERAQIWQSHGFAPMASELQQCDALLGRRISVEGVQGRAMGVDETGALLLQSATDAVPQRIVSGTVELLDAVG
jgi:BirA family biotin operon repressor/biotin-[acetyl-CoA-carboxylase] ligase